MKRWHLISALIPLLGCNHHVPGEQEARILSYETKPTELSENIPAKEKPKSRETSQVSLDVPLIRQNPELKHGCEVTSLAMVLQYAGVKVDKMELYKRVAKDTDPIVKSPSGDILKWGNPDEGFVGDMQGRRPGYAVFDKPMEQLVNEYLPGRAVNLTGQPFNQILEHVSKGYPVVAWTTGDYRLPDRWEEWLHGRQRIKTPLDLHAVVITGHDPKYVYLNDPLSGRKQVKVERKQFLASWNALKCRAISYF